jgi:SAM-dependent methyltransferase
LLSFHRTRLIQTLSIAALAWAGPMAALALNWWTDLPLAVEIGLALFGVALAIAAALRSSRVRRPIRIAPADDGHGGWERDASPEGNYANRWASYQHLSQWLGARDWAGTQVAEFGHTNGVLGAYLKGATHVLLEYPEHDVQRLAGVESHRFDLAILDQTLEHVADPERALAEVRRVLKPGGVAIVTTPFLVPLHGTDRYGDYTRWTPQGLATMLERCGFDPEVHAWGNLPAARDLLESMHLTAAEARARKLHIDAGENQEPYPITVWAIATVRA